MNFDWLISISTALLTSVLGAPAPAPKVPTPPIKSRRPPQGGGEKIPAVQQIDESKPATEADFIKEFNGVIKGKFVPREKLTEFEKKPLTKEKFAKNLLEKVEEKLPADFEYPPIKEVIKFRDISPKDEIFETAQKLKSLEILPENDGFFGKPNDKNPVVKISEMKQIIRKAFDKDGNLNYFADKDLDGVANSLDACPDIPAKTGNGCPEIKNDDKFPNDTVVKVSDKVKMVNEKEIEIGDKFSAIIFDPVSEEIFTESEPLTVMK